MFNISLSKYMDKIHLFDLYGNLRRKITKSQIVVMMYHRVGPMNDKWIFYPLHQKIFEEQMEYLSKNFEIVSLNSLTEMILRGSVPEKTAVITFDDGYKDNYEFAFPILKKYSIPATIFLATGPIEGRKLFWNDEVNYVLSHTDEESIHIKGIDTYQTISNEDKAKACLNVVEKLKKMENDKKEAVIEELINSAGVNIPDKLGNQNVLSWKEIKKMSKNGIDFGAHTVNHPILTNLPIDEAKWEIVESKNHIEETLGYPVKSFSCPNGDFDKNILSLIKNSGFNSSVSVNPGLVKNSIDELYQMNRIDGGLKEFHALKLNLCGLWGDLKRYF